MSYFFVLFGFPLLVIGLHGLTKPRPKLLLCIDQPQTEKYQNIFIVLFLFVFISFIWFKEDYVYLRRTILFSWEAGLALLFASMFSFNTIFRMKDGYVYWVVGLLILLKWHLDTFSESTSYAVYADGHFDVPFFSVFRACMASSSYPQCSSQYGLYGSFLIPIFKMIDFTVLNYTRVMATLHALCMFMTFYFLSRVYKSKLIALVVWITYYGTLNVLFIEYLKEMWAGSNEEYHFDPYFQFSPIRTLFPSILLIVLLLNEKIKNWKVQFFGSLIFALGVFWNLEAGLIALGTWGLSQFYLCKSWQAGFRSLLLTMGGAVVGVLTYFGYYYLQYGQNLDFASTTQAQKVFYLMGFFMLPMPIFGSWMIVALLLMWGLAYGILGWFYKVEDSSRFYIFSISIFGAGMFSYYQGRSHAMTLPAVTLWPLMIGGFILDSYFRQERKWHRFFLLFSLFIMFGTIAKNLSFVGDEFAARIGGSINEKISEDLTFLKSKIKPQDSVLFLSNNTGLLAAVTGAQSVTCNSFAEIFFRKDYDAIVNLLKKDNSFTIVLDTVWLAKVKAEQGREEIIRLIENEYVCDYVTPNKRFLSIHHSANVIKSESQPSFMSNCF